MLTASARTAVSKMLEWGCRIGIYPYSWDPKRFRLGPPQAAQTALYHIRRCFVLFMWFFNTLRVIQSSTSGNLPARLRVMNVSYIFGWFLVNLCYYQFQTKRGALLFCVNSLLEEVDRQGGREIGGRIGLSQSDQYKEGPAESIPEFNEQGIEIATRRHSLSRKSQIGKKDNDTGINWVSRLIIFSTLLLFVNPFTHALPTFDVPCAPQYLASVLMNCPTPMHDPAPWHLKLVLFLVETWLMSDIMFTYSFNSNLYFMAMTWIKQEVQRFEGNCVPGRRKSLDFIKVEAEYRHAQVLLALFNDAFRVYLTAFPSMLFLISGIYLFGSIRYFGLPFYAYWVFPTCTLRCLFEATSALFAAGLVNSESKLHLVHWDRELDRIPAVGEHERLKRKHIRAFRKSCPDLKCMAGSLYSFENSIVLVSLSNTLQLTMNLFTAFKK